MPRDEAEESRSVSVEAARDEGRLSAYDTWEGGILDDVVRSATCQVTTERKENGSRFQPGLGIIIKLD